MATPLAALPTRGLARGLGIGFGIAVAVGSMVGAGILRAPADVARLLPHPILFFGVWVIGGLYALLGANAVAELAAMHPRSGGQYVFARHAFGPFTGFVVGWNDWLSCCASVAAVAIVVGDAVAAIGRGGSVPALPVALLLVVSALVLGSRRQRATGRAQEGTSAVKALALLVLVAACFVRAFGTRPEAAGGVTATTAATALGFVVALQGVIFAYDGWVGAAYFSEELEQPGRDLPRALFGGVLAVLLLYLLVNLAFALVLPIPAMAREPLVAAAAAERVFGGRGDDVVRMIVAVALPSAALANLLMASRVLFAIGADTRAVRWAGDAGTAGVPRRALIASAVVSALFLLTGAFERVVALCAVLFVASYAVSFAAVFRLRTREPEVARPWRARGHPWTTGLVLLGSVAFLAATVVAAPRDAAIAGGLVLLAYPAFRLLGSRRERHGG